MDQGFGARVNFTEVASAAEVDFAEPGAATVKQHATRGLPQSFPPPWPTYQLPHVFVVENGQLQSDRMRRAASGSSLQWGWFTPHDASACYVFSFVLVRNRRGRHGHVRRGPRDALGQLCLNEGVN